jgi:hypothetical protein
MTPELDGTINLDTRKNCQPVKNLVFLLIDPYGKVVKSENSTQIILSSFMTSALTDEDASDLVRRFRSSEGIFNLSSTSISLKRPGETLSDQYFY